MENYFWHLQERLFSRKLFILVIYDIIDNKRRTQFAKHLAGYGFRVQKSAFEALLEEHQFYDLLDEVPLFIDEEEDSIRIYRMKGYGDVRLFGKNTRLEAEDVIIF